MQLKLLGTIVELFLMVFNQSILSDNVLTFRVVCLNLASICKYSSVYSYGQK